MSNDDQRDSRRPTIQWIVVKTFSQKEAMVEVSKSESHQARFSYRVTWADGTRKGPWFPDRGISFLEDIASVITQAEGWILGENDKVIKEREARLADRKVKEEAKRKRHDANLEARRESNRVQGKGAKR